MSEGQEQNRTEEATPFKLQKAREKGMVARGMDLGFVAGLIGFAAFATMAGAQLIVLLTGTMRRALTSGIGAANDPQAAASLGGRLLWPLLTPIALFGVTLLAVVLLIEIVQLRGLSFSAFPLKPDFTRLNPAKGFKRIFSMRALKEAIKAFLKTAVYTTVAFMVIRSAVDENAIRITDAASLTRVLHAEGIRLLLIFIVVAAIFAVIDQVLARGEFRKQMRMSRRDVTRESKEREGDPRQKSKRKQLHAEFVKQSKGLGNLPGSDLMIVNPRHFAVALSYRPGEMEAPRVTAKAADRQALQLKAAARQHGIPIFEVPALARAIFRETEMGQTIAPTQYHAVAQLYYKIQETARV
jgi:flagellar biosynthetic protein FlhB